ncbi:helix-turn-helix domain-containing protein [Ruficoccus sp. ZRK36]|uniref:helix-turn-helix domain-containing protein n=1 Tax=Ruficoccus sp. ZRK36 TaxID=2866311 RepID=UPI001C737B09|nr:helix-turn-helix domain-containing protein [Ruficoccus sp. ZRK36]QYY36367.1 helix-turn-helix domain-containing protein [Ruficoccus sp. ZRK36]
MKPITPLSFCEAETAAPALNRGLGILAALAQSAPQSLEALASSLKLPKASVFRLLGALETVGMIRKTAQKTYEPLWSLQPAADARTLLRHRLEPRMAELCASTGCTIEWYEPDAEGMRLILQKNPESELCVKARPGFIRHWGEQIEAVARLGYAFYQKAPEPGSMQLFVKNGESEVLSLKKVTALIEAARRENTAADLPYNDNGVRRFAVAVHDPESGDFLGVLSLAEAYHFTERPGADSYLEQLNNLLH